MKEQWVYLFDEVDDAEQRMDGDWDKVRALLGGKGANLGEMTRLGVPVPPGFTITTRGCMTYLNNDNQLPDGLWDEVLTKLAAIEQKQGKRFGDPANPLLVSSRSGAKFSMPGMMDTVLNIGLNDLSVEALAALTQDPRFAYDLYRRLIQMFGNVVLGVSDATFEKVISAARKAADVQFDSELSAEQWQAVIADFKQIVQDETGKPFPQEPLEQLRLAIEAVFGSWNGKRAVDYRNAAGIDHDLGTAVNIQTMVFGNMGEGSGTGVLFSRNPATGDNLLYGDYLFNAQGEDVVAGIRQVQPIATLNDEMPDAYEALQATAKRLETHFANVQDIEFTIERGTLYILQTRDGKRTAKAAVKFAVDMANEGLISREEAVRRVTPAQVDIFLHPRLDPEAKKRAAKEGRLLATGVNASPGAAVGIAAFDADIAEQWGKDEGKAVIMVRPETKPDDVHGMLAAKGILTSHGGNSSHAAIVARQFGVPAVVGCSAVEVDLSARALTVGSETVREGEWLSLDGTTGEVFAGKISTVPATFDDPDLATLLGWADEFRRLGVRANADYPEDAARARDFGAEGIGLCRTEHMFFQEERLPIVQKMILANDETERQAALDKLLPYQREDFEGLFKAMEGQPIIIRLIDPPLHEFLPNYEALLKDVERLHTQQEYGELSDEERRRMEEEEGLLVAEERMREANPMLGLRGVRLGIETPGVMAMQVRAIFEAACAVKRDGTDVQLEVMIPLVGHLNELRIEQSELERVAKEVMDEQGIEVPYMFGTMIELPRACVTAHRIATVAEFFSFGTNDLTQTTFGISRDDAEGKFLVDYVQRGILPFNPFQTIDRNGVGELMRIAVERGRSIRPDIELGICGEHGGDPASIEFCHQLGLDYVSCSPFRVPVARLAAAQAALADNG
ncbi:MAG: pyruvate, phosphate dikinase [Ardenticatenales bacterium]|nr:pyruvate, phosphate dikinase [Ardenticatenales bacterium]